MQGHWIAGARKAASGPRRRSPSATSRTGGASGSPRAPEFVDVHAFPSDAVGKAIPYDIYDLAANDGFVNVGTDHDTPVFAATIIEAW